MSAVPKVPPNVTAGQAQSQLVKDRTRVLGSADADSKYGSMCRSVRIQCQPLLVLKCLIKNVICGSLLRHLFLLMNKKQNHFYQNLQHMYKDKHIDSLLLGTCCTMVQPDTEPSVQLDVELKLENIKFFIYLFIIHLHKHHKIRTPS